MITRGRLRELLALRRREGRLASGVYLIEGRRLVEEAIASGAPVREVLATSRFAGSEEGAALLARAGAAGAAVETVGERDLSRLADTKTPQGVLAVVERVEADRAALSADGLLLLLDGVADPGNVGTLVRAADAFGASAVVAGAGSAGFENPKVLRAAMGSTFHLPLLVVADLASLVAELSEEGVVVLAATLAGGDAHEFPVKPGRLALVLGNEAHGVSKAVLEQVSSEVTVPCPGRAESLNVAMAGAILLSLLSRGRE